MPINIANEEIEVNSDSSTQVVKTEFGDLILKSKENPKDGFDIEVTLSTSKCSFTVGSSGDVRSGTSKGDSTEILNALIQHLYSGASLKMK